MLSFSLQNKNNGFSKKSNKTTARVRKKKSRSMVLDCNKENANSSLNPKSKETGFSRLRKRRLVVFLNEKLASNVFQKVGVKKNFAAIKKLNLVNFRFSSNSGAVKKVVKRKKCRETSSDSDSVNVSGVSGDDDDDNDDDNDDASQDNNPSAELMADKIKCDEYLKSGGESQCKLKNGFGVNQDEESDNDDGVDDGDNDCPGK